MDNKAVYVGVEESEEIRKRVLNYSIDLISFLERYEHIKEIRVNKQNELLYLKNLLRSVKELLAAYKDCLPWVREGEHKEQHKEKNKKGEKKQEFKVKKFRKSGVTELDKLETELNGLKEKLNKVESSL